MPFDANATAQPAVPNILQMWMSLSKVDLTILGIVIAGCVIAWAMSYGVERLTSLRRLWTERSTGPRVAGVVGSVPSRSAPSTSALSWFEGTLLGLSLLVMIGALCAAVACMVQAGETLVMSVAGLIAIAATPICVMVVETVQIPRLSRRAVLRLSAVPTDAASEPESPRLAA